MEWWGMMSASLTIDLGPRMSGELHATLAELVEALTATAGCHAGVPGMDAALSVVLQEARRLGAAVEPGPVVPLPSDEELGWPVPDSGGCPVPIRLDLEPARALVLQCRRWSSRLNDHLSAIARSCPAGKAPKPLVHRFAGVMGYLYLELARPLHQHHPELESIALGE